MNLFITKKIGDKEYKVFLPLFWFTVAALLFIATVGFSDNDWSLESKFYQVCNKVDGCPNDYYNSISCSGSVYEYTDLCQKPFLNYNEYIGTKPSFITKNMTLLSFVILFLFLIGNTALFNKEILKNFKSEESE